MLEFFLLDINCFGHFPIMRFFALRLHNISIYSILSFCDLTHHSRSSLAFSSVLGVFANINSGEFINNEANFYAALSSLRA